MVALEPLPFALIKWKKQLHLRSTFNVGSANIQSTFLITIKVTAESLSEADDIACAMSEDVQGSVVTVSEDQATGNA